MLRNGKGTGHVQHLTQLVGEDSRTLPKNFPNNRYHHAPDPLEKEPIYCDLPPNSYQPHAGTLFRGNRYTRLHANCSDDGTTSRRPKQENPPNASILVYVAGKLAQLLTNIVFLSTHPVWWSTIKISPTTMCTIKSLP